MTLWHKKDAKFITTQRPFQGILCKKDAILCKNKWCFFWEKKITKHPRNHTRFPMTPISLGLRRGSLSHCEQKRDFFPEHSRRFHKWEGWDMNYIQLFPACLTLVDWNVGDLTELTGFYTQTQQTISHSVGLGWTVYNVVYNLHVQTHQE